MIPLPADLSGWRAHLERLLALERRAELDRAAHLATGVALATQEADGLLLRHLHVVDDGPGPGGLWRLNLGRADSGALPRLAMTPGQPVGLGPAGVLAAPGRTGAVQGTLERVSATGVSVLTDARDVDDLPNEKLALWPLPGTVTLQRMDRAVASLDALGGAQRSLAQTLLGVGPVAAPVGGNRAAADPAPLAGLNDAQAQAVATALNAPQVALIHGPPGTGKTHTLAALVEAAVGRGQRVLVCAASNAGADQAAAALGQRQVDVVRLGHPARVDEALHPLLLEQRVAAHPRTQLARTLYRQAENLRNRSGASRKNAAEARAQRQQRRIQWRSMVADARRLMDQAEAEVLDRARVVCCTLAGAASNAMANQGFDLCVVDEASQALTPALLMALPLADRMVLAGDHHQLPPTVLSLQAARAGLDHTAFDSLINSGAVPATLLTQQHRMHADLMAFPNAFQYGGALTAHPAAAQRTLQDRLGKPVTDPDLMDTLAFIDTAGTGFSEELPPGGTSRCNPGEAQLCAHLVHRLLAAGLAPTQVAVVVPYRAQADALARILAAPVAAGVEVDTVDAFQGREKDAVVVGLVRSNDRGEMGFVEDRRRLNVALTRARCWLRVVGDGGTVGLRGAGEALLQHAVQHNVHVSAYALALWPDLPV